MALWQISHDLRKNKVVQPAYGNHSFAMALMMIFLINLRGSLHIILRVITTRHGVGSKDHEAVVTEVCYLEISCDLT